MFLIADWDKQVRNLYYKALSMLLYKQDCLLKNKKFNIKVEDSEVLWPFGCFWIYFSGKSETSIVFEKLKAGLKEVEKQQETAQR